MVYLKHKNHFKKPINPYTNPIKIDIRCIVDMVSIVYTYVHMGVSFLFNFVCSLLPTYTHIHPILYLPITYTPFSMISLVTLPMTNREEQAITALQRQWIRQRVYEIYNIIADIPEIGPGYVEYLKVGL